MATAEVYGADNNLKIIEDRMYDFHFLKTTSKSTLEILNKELKLRDYFLEGMNDLEESPETKSELSRSLASIAINAFYPAGAYFNYLVLAGMNFSHGCVLLRNKSKSYILYKLYYKEPLDESIKAYPAGDKLYENQQIRGLNISSVKTPCTPYLVSLLIPFDKRKSILDSMIDDVRSNLFTMDVIVIYDPDDIFSSEKEAYEYCIANGIDFEKGMALYYTVTASGIKPER